MENLHDPKIKLVEPLVEPYVRIMVNSYLDLINGLLNYYKAIGRSPEESTFLKHVRYHETTLIENWHRLRVFVRAEFEADYAGLALRMIGDSFYETAEKDGQLVEKLRLRSLIPPEPYWPAFLQRLAEVINQPPPPRPGTIISASGGPWALEFLIVIILMGLILALIISTRHLPHCTDSVNGPKQALHQAAEAQEPCRE